ncbi:hypothetical protein GCM10027060_02120 [Nesterenkonia halophila]
MTCQLRGFSGTLGPVTGVGGVWGASSAAPRAGSSGVLCAMVRFYALVGAERRQPRRRLSMQDAPESVAAQCCGTTTGLFLPSTAAARSEGRPRAT